MWYSEVVNEAEDYTWAIKASFSLNDVYNLFQGKILITSSDIFILFKCGWQEVVVISFVYKKKSKIFLSNQNYSSYNRS